MPLGNQHGKGIKLSGVAVVLQLGMNNLTG